MNLVRLGHVREVLIVLVEAYVAGGVSASRLAEMLEYRVGDLHSAGLQAVANMTFEAGTELQEYVRAIEAWQAARRAWVEFVEVKHDGEHLTPEDAAVYERLVRAISDAVATIDKLGAER